MKTITVKVTPIGNSRGIRIPSELLKRYRIGDSLLMEERSEGLMLYPQKPPAQKLSWEETAREMAAAREDWSAWDVIAADGLESVPWEARQSSRVSEQKSRYGSHPHPTRKK
ncbi:MAG: AbrB/MazE/SpoVT family DNA-binding domain-containing protein [Candidatus Aminicenantales bacterium]|jgi:antitoxin component of MazEF toxin-antitoxin module